MKKKSGILYCLSNKLWGDNVYKCGLTTQKIKKRLSNIQTSLYLDCIIECHTDELIDCFIYEKLLKLILKNYRLRSDREFYCVTKDEIIMIFNFFNQINITLNDNTKLNEFFKLNNPETNNKYIKKNSTKSKGLYSDTRY